MVIGALWTKRKVQEARAEAREEEHQRWSDWNRRREEAEVKGEAFTEPPPPPPEPESR